MKYDQVRLGDILYIKGRVGWKGLKKSEYLTGGTYRIINGESLRSDGIDWKRSGYITKERYDESPEIKLQKRDILISKDGTIGKVAYVDYLESPSTIASGIFLIRNLKPEIIETRYIYNYFYSKDFRNFIKTRTEGSVIPHLYQKDFVDLVFPLPNIKIQRKIVKILDALNKKIKMNDAINHNLEQQAQAIFNIHIPYSIVDTVPPGWKIGSMGEIIELHDSKRIPLSSTDRMKMKNKTYPYYGAASLVDYVDDYIFDGKFLLLGEDGTITDAAGYPILQYVWGKFWVNNHAHILTGKLGFNVESLYLLFKQTPVSSIITGAVQPKISQANLRSIPGVIPPRHILDEINDRIEPLFSQIRTNIDQNNLLISLRDTLLPRLMSGKIDVSNIKI